MFGSVNIACKSDSKGKVLIFHLTVSGLTQWIIGRKVMRTSDVLHYSGTKILMPPIDGVRDSREMVHDRNHL